MFPEQWRYYPLVLFLAVHTLFGGSAPRYSLGNINPDGAELSLTVPARRCGSSEQSLFAFSSLPGQSFSVTAVTADGRSLVCVPGAAGWAGAHYLQWYALQEKSIPRSGSDQTVRITIRFSAPVYRAVDPRRVTLTNGILRVPLPRPLRKTTAVLPVLPYRSGVRMAVSEDGVYELTGTMLRELGVPIERIPAKRYRLYLRDREVPLYLPDAHHSVLAPDDRILFYGTKLRSASGTLISYSETNCYWLVWDGGVGARVGVVSGARRIDPTVYTTNPIAEAREYLDTVRLEEDNMILWLGNIDGQPADELAEDPDRQADAIDDWYWGLVGGKKLTSFTLQVAAPSVRGNARIRCGFMGRSSVDSITPDHQLEVFINNEPAGPSGTARWDGQRAYVFESDTFPNELLVHGENVLTFNKVSSSVDLTALNWVEIEYLRGYRAEGNRARFKSSPQTLRSTVEYAVEGFSEKAIDVWDVTNNRTFFGMLTERGTGRTRGTYTLVFQDSVTSVTSYVVQSSDLRRHPDAMMLDTIADDATLFEEADYLVISADSFRTDLAPLLEVHRDNGLSTLFVSIDDIYNRFCYGVRDPDGIRRFLAYLFSLPGKKTPRFLLLGGDTTHDRDKKNQSRNVVPTHLSRIPGWGPGADDGYFATVSGEDLFPDLAVGRLPAQNRSEMRTMVDKTIRYINEPDWSYWRDRLLLLGGGEPVFTQFNNEVETESIGSRMQLFRMDADPQSTFYKEEFVAPQMIADHCNAGVLIVNFNGHGGGNVWSDNNFFGYNDLPKLHNGQWGGGGRLPVVFSFTCLTGFFESAEYRSLGEEFVRTGNDGAIAFYGASAYTSRSGNLIMNRLLLEFALGGEWSTLGEMIADCEMNMLVRYGNNYLHLVRQFNLLGDPALPWRMVPDTLSFSSSVDDTSATLSVEGTEVPLRSGRVKVSVDAAYQTWGSTVATVDKGDFSCTIALKEGLESSLATVRTYAWNDSGAVRGWQPFIRDSLGVFNVTTRPEALHFGDSAVVRCELPGTANDSSVQVYCFYTMADKYDPLLTFTEKAMVAEEPSRWSTDGGIPLDFSGTVQQRLLVYFRAVSASATLQSRIFAFGIGGRPDLTVAQKSVEVSWRDDSLRIGFSVLNIGNVTAPPFSVAGLWTEGNVAVDTITRVGTGDSLSPGTSRAFSLAFADTQGVLHFSLEIPPHTAFNEIDYDNNRYDGESRVYFRDMRSTGDSLVLPPGNLTIAPASAYRRKHRVFFIEDTTGSAQPLSTPSVWLARRGSAGICWYAAARPPLATDDSLLWTWNRSPVGEVLPADLSLKKVCFMLYDTLVNQWRSYDGSEMIAVSRMAAFTMNTVTGISFAPAVLSDDRLPDCMVSVYGKELARPDYTAKDRPFTIILSDQSGVVPQSVELFLNGKKLATTAHSEVPLSGDLRSMNISAYPEVERKVDSLTVHCTDFAGNAVKRTFAYLPGSDLTIKAFSCHPNPFTGRKRPDGTIAKIRFAFLLTDIATRATLSIYTASGKKIMSWKRSELIGYQQIEWDGRDRDGYRLANGTYYAKLVVANDRKKAKKIIRIAKLEGF